MNLSKLRQAEEAFLHRYPGGFRNPELVAIRTKKHNVDTMITFVQESFAERSFPFPDQIVQNLIKVVSRSSIISRFEKPRFRDVVGTFSLEERRSLANGLGQLLHGNEQLGFQATLDLLTRHKLARWPLMTVCQSYFHPHRDVLIKPTTVKGIIDYFELRNLQYKPTPGWTFYDSYRSIIHDMKSKVDACLSPSNTAFSWFLLLSFHGKVF